MKKIVILGSTAEVVERIEKIRAEDQESLITLMPFDGSYPYKQDLFMQVIGREISLAEVFCKGKEFYKKQNVEVLLGKKITRINFKRQRIFTEDKIQVEYDELFILDVPEYELPDIKGVTKNSVYGLKRLKDIEEILNQLLFVDTVMIQSNSLSGLQAAEAFLKSGKEVMMVVPEPDEFESFLDEEKRQWVGGLEEKGLRIIWGEWCSEILGDKEVKAVRLKSGKVMACGMIVFGEVLEDFKMFSNAGLQVSEKICVDENFKTNFENVCASPGLCSKEEARPSFRDSRTCSNKGF